MYPDQDTSISTGPSTYRGYTDLASQSQPQASTYGQRWSNYGRPGNPNTQTDTDHTDDIGPPLPPRLYLKPLNPQYQVDSSTTDSTGVPLDILPSIIANQNESLDQSRNAGNNHSYGPTYRGNEPYNHNNTNKMKYSSQATESTSNNGNFGFSRDDNTRQGINQSHPNEDHLQQPKKTRTCPDCSDCCDVCCAIVCCCWLCD
ncbi:uncharacterized protein L201_001162 [Kwoniella dendrophila CBS 6074]|uniref:Cysteine-rich transmembrane CYSTM domain-containing protein n=1 Tax=Kwoniella dendrophila CBS 6074 TaxID=1295534 RepID=A0AAX4JNH5_9TREE